jgi:hypothetical protein
VLVFGVKDLTVDKSKYQKTYNLISETLTESNISAVAITDNVTYPLYIRLDNGRIVEYGGDIDDSNSILEFAVAETMPLVTNISD